MLEFYKCVEIKYADGTFLLVPKKEKEMDLVMLGFDGTEKWIRLQCRQNHSQSIADGTWDYTATICRADGNSWSWDWGFHGFDLVSDRVREMQKKIVEACKIHCLTKGIGFPGKGW